MENTDQRVATMLRAMKAKRKKQYLLAIENYVRFIERDPTNPDNAEYLFNIIRDIGYLAMIETELENELLTKIRRVFDLEICDDGSSTPTFIDFNNLFFEKDSYISMCKDLDEGVLNPPRMGEGREKEDIWEDFYGDVKDKGLQLVIRGFDTIAVKKGFELLLGDAKKIKGWLRSWESFLSMSDEYLKGLYEVETQFYPLSDNVFKMLADFPYIPEGEFRNFLLKITSRRESYVKEQYYRQIMSFEDVEELYHRTKIKFGDYASAAWIYFYKNALAEKMLKSFIFRICLAKTEGNSAMLGDWELKSTLDEGFDSVIPMLRAGGKEYSIHMLSNRRLSGWGIRKDRMNPFLSPMNTDFQGALFCSCKEYINGAMLVRFDNYIKRDRFENLLRQKEESFKDFIRLSIADVYEQDLRDKFLQEAAEAVMGLEKQPDWVSKFLEQLFIAPERILDETVKVLGKISAVLEPEFKGALAPATAMALSGEQKDGYYVPVASLKDTIFLSPRSSNTCVSRAVNRSFIQQWQCIWLFIDKDSNVIDGVHGPSKMKTKGVKIEDVPDHAECVWFFIGPLQTVDKIKTGYSENKTLKITKQEKLYWIIYGPEK